MSTLKTRLALAAGAAALSAGMAGMALSGTASGASDVQLTPVALDAAVLAQETPAPLKEATAQLKGTEVATEAAQRAEDVPLPAGEHFDDIHWQPQGETPALVDQQLQLNAACKWWLANTDNPTAETQQVVAIIPSWPALSYGDAHTFAADIADGATTPLAQAILKQCRDQVG